MIQTSPATASSSLTSPDESDEALLLRVRRGDHDAFGVLYARHRSASRAYASRLVPSADVDDVVSEAFAKTLRAIRRQRGPVDHPERYLMVAVRSTAISITARRARQESTKRRVARETITPSEDVPPSLLGDERLEAAFASLAPRWRLIIWRTEVEGRKPSEIGPEMGISADAAAALAYRARQALRQAYAERGADAEGASAADRPHTSPSST